MSLQYFYDSSHRSLARIGNSHEKANSAFPFPASVKVIEYWHEFMSLYQCDYLFLRQ